MLDSIIAMKDNSWSVLIQDVKNLKGFNILMCFAKSLCKKFNHVDLICFDQSFERWKLTKENSDALKRLVLHDAHSDSKNWNCSNADFNFDVVKIEKSIGSILESNLQGASNTNHQSSRALIFDCLSPLILHNGVNKVCQLLANLQLANFSSGTINRVVYLVHTDLHTDKEIRFLEYHSEVVLYVRPGKSATGNPVPMCWLVCKPTGKKVQSHVQQYSVTPNYDLVCQGNTPKTFSGSSTKQVDPAANLTFNLHLTDSEIKERSRIELPYIKTKTNNLQPTKMQLEDYYEDEEDPDNDLDI